jgi:hypothetical protein
VQKFVKPVLISCCGVPVSTSEFAVFVRKYAIAAIEIVKSSATICKCKLAPISAVVVPNRASKWQWQEFNLSNKLALSNAEG